MTKEKFIETCAKSGYCKKQTANKYVKDSDKDTFDENDFEEVFRIETRKTEQDQKYDRTFHSSKWRNYEGLKTTKHFARFGNGKK